MSIELGDLLGAVMAEVTRARVQADVEAAELADLYATDPLLRHMPVPRFRLPDVHIDIPVVVDDVQPGGGSTDPPTMPSATKRKQMVTNALAFAELKLKPAQREQIHAAVDAELTRVGKGPASLLRPREVIRGVQAAAERGLLAAVGERSEPPGRAEIQRFGSAVAETLRADLATQVAKRHRLQVLPRSQDVHMLGDSSDTVHVRMTISEDAYEMRLGSDDAGDVIEHFGPE